jgi:hypothetical protein
LPRVPFKTEARVTPVELRKMPVAAPVSVRVMLSVSTPVPPVCVTVTTKDSVEVPERFLAPSSTVRKTTFEPSVKEVWVTPEVFVRAKRSVGCRMKVEPLPSGVRSILPAFVIAPMMRKT